MTIEELKIKKTSLGLTNEMIAKAADIPLSTVQKIMSGATKAPRKLTLEAIESVLFAEEQRKAMEQRNTANFSTGSFSNTSHPLTDHLSGSVSFPYDVLPENDMKAMVKEAATGYSHLSSAMKKAGKYTLDDYYALPDHPRVELIDGVFYNMAFSTSRSPRFCVGGSLPCQSSAGSLVKTGFIQAQWCTGVLDCGS